METKGDDMGEKKHRIAQFGTYDIESLGDTSFPKALSYGLNKQFPVDIELFSMNECPKPYNGNSYVYSFHQFTDRHKENPYDAIILGGGEFIHFSPMMVFINGSRTKYPEGYIWEKPLEYARQECIPAIINCVGVSYDLMKSEGEKLRKAAASVRYWSVRDQFSERRLASAGIENVTLVADNLWYLNQMYSKDWLESARRKLEEKYAVDLTTPYIIVQYGTTRDADALSTQLRDIKVCTGCRICLMAVNYCHEDWTGVKLLAEAGSGEFETLDMYLQPPEMIAVISGASAFLGTSLHGNLTAASYDVPFVGLDMYSNFVSKMDGIFSMMECEKYLVPVEAGLAAAYFARMEDTDCSMRVAEKIREAQHKLDDHFAKMLGIIGE